MKQFFFLLLTLVVIAKSQAQYVFEYTRDYDIKFKVYDTQESIMNKLMNASDFRLESPELTAQAYFFALDDSVLKSTFLKPEEAPERSDTHYKNIATTPSNDMHVQLLHKMNYNNQGTEMCYIMFIAKIKDVPFPFPTLLSLVKKENKWLIYDRSNQHALTECLMMFKSCILSALIEGKSSTSKSLKQVLDNAKTKDNYLDFIALYDEFLRINSNENEEELKELTIAETLDCDIQFKATIENKVSFTGLFDKIMITKYEKKDQEKNIDLINKIKKNNDSIVLHEKIELEYSKKQYSVVKYSIIKSNSIENKTIRISKNDFEIYTPVKNLIFLYENLNSQIFLDLVPKMNENESQMKNVLFKETRGNFNVLNITKMHNLFLKDKNLFNAYIE